MEGWLSKAESARAESACRPTSDSYREFQGALGIFDAGVWGSMK